MINRQAESNDAGYPISLACGLAILFDGLENEMGHLIDMWTMQHSKQKPDTIDKTKFLWICDLIKDLAKKRDFTLAAPSLYSTDKKQKQKDWPELPNIDKSHQKGPGKGQSANKFRRIWLEK